MSSLDLSIDFSIIKIMAFLITLLFFSQEPRETNPVKIVFNSGIQMYQKFISPSQGDVCNFYPSCSHYAAQSINKYGIFVGALMASDRLMRCNPNALNYYGTYYSEIKQGKLYDPPENNFIFGPIKKSFDTIIEGRE